MKMLLSESQLRNLAEVISNDNFMPSYEFDKKYGTSISQVYSFPGGLSDDQVWKIYKKSYNWRDPSNLSDEFDEIVNGLSEEYFPYKNVDKLDYETKKDIILGMSSRFNVEDIIWYSIKHVIFTKNGSVLIKIEKYVPEIKSDIRWVLSPFTIDKIISQLRK